jgi:uncharacterized protein (TIGR02996 family)
MSEQARLLDEIRAARADDIGPRLVYADWLLERGDARGEVIRILCEQPERRSQITNRLDEVWKYATGVLHYGLAEAAILREGMASIPEVEEGLRQDPITELVVYKLAAGDVGQFAAWMAETGIRRLVLGVGITVGDEGVATLLRALGPRLQKLTIRDLTLTDRTAVRLSELPALETLELHAREVGNAGLAALADGVAPLRWLRLLSGQVHGAGLERLASSVCAPRLAHLALCEHSLGGAPAAAALDRFTGLTYLDLSWTSIGVHAAVLARALAALPLLEHVGLQDVGLGTEGGQVLAAAPLPPRLRRLVLSPTDVGKEVVELVEKRLAR